MNVIDAIRTKRAIRLFTDQQVSDEAARAILDAGRRAQSSKNAQRWHFVAVRNRDTLKQLAQCGDFAGHLAGAALGIALVAPHDPDNQDWIMFDLGQAAANMQLAAWELGIGSCIATIYQPDRAKAILHVPAELSLDVAISFGYPAPAAAPRVGGGRGGRRPLEDVEIGRAHV